VLTVFDLLLIAAAFLIMLRGFHERWSWSRWAARDLPEKGSVRSVVRYLLGHRVILARKKAGLAHLALFWGMVFMVLVVVAAQFKPVFPKGAALAVSLSSEIVGAALAAGALYFSARRMREGSQKGPWRALLPLAVVLVIVITGFLAEGSRLSILPSGEIWASPVGWILSLGLPDSPLLMQFMIRIHFASVLLLVALLPYTAFRHIAAAAANIYHGSERRKGRVRPLSLVQGDLGAGSVRDLTWSQCLDAEACVACGRCEEQCPAFASGKALSPRNVVQGLWRRIESSRGNRKSPGEIDLGEAVTDGEIWSCTGCMACAVHCPVMVDPLDKILDMRRFRTLKKGGLPPETRPLMRDLETYGDAYGRGAAHRMDWAFGVSVPVVAGGRPGPDVLVWVGCSGAFHPQYMEAAASFAEILNRARVSYAVLGKEELCCGDPARRLGEESLFLELARRNIATLRKCKVKTVVPLCPHCYHTLRHDYEDLGAGFGVIHAVDYILELIRKKSITLKYPVEKKIAVHDPCYLGRANGLYAPIRELLSAVPGVDLRELPRNRENAFCCGGGNGGMWLHETTGERMNRIRAEEAAGAGIDVLATACPYCLTMLQDGMGALEREKPPAVLDVIKLAASSMAGD